MMIKNINNKINYINENPKNENIKSINKNCDTNADDIKDMIINLKKAEMIALKIVKNEKISKEELIFLEQNYPEIKEMVCESSKEIGKLKEEIEKFNLEIEKEEIISNYIKEVEFSTKNGVISELYGNIKLCNLETMLDELEEYKKIIKDDKSYLENYYMFFQRTSLENKLACITCISLILIIVYIFK